MYHVLIEHPSVAPHRHFDGKPLKELHFFDIHMQRGPEWFKETDDLAGRRTVDATPDYLADLGTHRQIHRLLPDAKLIVTLRNPVDRCVGAYNHYYQHYPATASWDWSCPGSSFAQNVVEELSGGAPSIPSSLGLVGRGYYATQLDHLLKFFAREQLHVMIMERWTTRFSLELTRLFGFLDLTMHDMPLPHLHRRNHIVHADQRTIALLQEIYRPHNERLFSLLGYEIEEWHAPR